MNYTVSFRLGGWAAALFLLSAPLLAQQVKENRNNYPKPLPKVEKLTLSVHRAEPFIFSPHLSYKEQKQIQLAKKKAGGITFVLKSSGSFSGKKSTDNYKRPTINTNPTLTPSEQRIADTTAPFVRYEWTDSLKNR
ncbi:hypothetical protein [Runella sp.]|uniref:hypothetical protein n=1 Tax=Runella sp. TaxID=1960881 RepID=UPI003D11BAD8